MINIYREIEPVPTNPSWQRCTINIIINRGVISTLAIEQNARGSEGWPNACHLAAYPHLSRHQI